MKNENRDLKQPRFFCENCKREVFLQAKHCDGCGGEITWPEKYKSLIEKMRLRSQAIK